MRYFFLVLILAFQQLAFAQISGSTMVVNMPEVEVHYTDDISSEIVQVLKQGEEVTIVDLRKLNELDIKDYNGMIGCMILVNAHNKDGYVFSAYLRDHYNMMREFEPISVLPATQYYYGLYTSAKGDELRKIEVYFDPQKDEYGRQYNFLRVKNQKDTSMLIIATDKELKAGIVGNYYSTKDDYWVFNSFLKPGDILPIPLDAYRLSQNLPVPSAGFDFLVAGKYEYQENDLLLSDYKVYLRRVDYTRNYNYEAKEISLISGGPRPAHLTWYGDLDGDGVPDFTVFNGWSSEILYLSSEAKEGEWVHPVTSYTGLSTE